MIAVDSSALIAILEEEDDATDYATVIADADPPMVSAASVVETGIVLVNRYGAKGLDKLDRLLKEAGFQVESVTAQHTHRALQAYAAYGKGQKSKAGLNFGDCFSYALAKVSGVPLLFKGRDFSETDVPSAL